MMSLSYIRGSVDCLEKDLKYKSIPQIKVKTDNIRYWDYLQICYVYKRSDRQSLMGKKRIIRFLYINWIIRMTRQLHQRLTELILFPNRLSVPDKLAWDAASESLNRLYPIMNVRSRAASLKTRNIHHFAFLSLR